MTNSDDDTIWDHPELEVSVEANGVQIDASPCRVRLLDYQSAVFQLVSSNEPFTLILDLQTSVVKQPSVDDETLSYSYGRFDHQGELHFGFVTDEKKEERVSITQALEFVFSQYTLYSEFNILQEDSASDAQHPNMVARGLEGMGIGFRLALRSGGRSTGSAIRYLGKKYTSATVTDNKDGLKEFKAIKQQQIDTAGAHKARAKSCHAGARTLTSAALAPVRWIGKNASKIAPKSHTGDGPVRKVIVDTVGGLGNGVANICKGVTEALSEIGGAVGDATIHHSTAKNGEDYAGKVTKQYVDAAAEIGLAGYKIGNIASFGVTGLMLDAVVEGATFLISLYEYLVGPVLLQGYMNMVQFPSTVPVMYFVVLRPWSVSFYTTASMFTGKPVRIIATSMLDTLPFLRHRGLSDKGQDDPQGTGEGVSGSFVVDLPVPVGDREGKGGDSDQAASTPLLTPHTAAIHDGKFSYVSRMKGGNTSHIELCTVDCSTYLLYPDAALIDTWFAELNAAALRVETIEKRKSGADELALLKRLKLLPKRKYIRVVLKRIVISPLDAIAETAEKEGKGEEGLPMVVDIPSRSPVTVSSGPPQSLPVASAPPTEGEDMWDLCEDSPLQDSPLQDCPLPSPNIIEGHVDIITDSAPPTEPHPAAATREVTVTKVRALKEKEKEGKEDTSWSDATRNRTLRAAYVRIKPLTYEGIMVTSEEVSSSKSILKRHDKDLPPAGTPLSSEGDKVKRGSLTAEWGAEGEGAVLSKSCFDIGRLACVDTAECEKLSVAVRVQIPGGNTLELGRGFLPLLEIGEVSGKQRRLSGRPLDSEPDKWVSVYKKGSSKLVAIVLLSVLYHPIEDSISDP